MRSFLLVLSISVTCEERRPILTIILFFFDNLWVLFIFLPCVHGECGWRHYHSSHEQQSNRQLQQCSAAASASVDTAAATISILKPVTTAAAAISDKTFYPFKQHPKPAQQPPYPNVHCTLSTNTQHTQLISSHFSVHSRAYNHIQFGTWTGVGFKKRDQQCQPNVKFRLGWPSYSFKHDGWLNFWVHTCPLCSGSSIRGLGSEQHHSVQ